LYVISLDIDILYAGVKLMYISFATAQ